jgi:hypothetical protein
LRRGVAELATWIHHWLTSPAALEENSTPPKREYLSTRTMGYLPLDDLAASVLFFAASLGIAIPNEMKDILIDVL